MKLAFLIGLLLMVTPALAAYSNSTIYCDVGNTSLIEVLTVSSINTSNYTQVLNSSSYALQTACPYGCDNSSSMCNPAPYQQGIFNLAIIIIIVIGMVLVYRFARR